MGLRPVPGAALAQRVHEGGEPCHLRTGGHPTEVGPSRHVERGQMVRLHGPVELPPVDGGHHLVVEPEVVEDHRSGEGRAGVVVLVEGELDVGERLARPALGDQERAALAHGRRSEHTGIDETDSFGQRVDAECRPGQVQEGERGDNRDPDAAVAAQQLHAPFGHERRPGDGIDDRLRRRVPCRRYQCLDDPGVHLLEGRGGLVEVIEGASSLDAGRGGMPDSPQIGAPRHGEKRRRTRHRGSRCRRARAPPP